MHVTVHTALGYNIMKNNSLFIMKIFDLFIGYLL